MARAPRRRRTFHQELVLNRWMLGHFHGDGLMTLKARLGVVAPRDANLAELGDLP